MNNTKQNLFYKLKDFHPDKDFVVGVMSNATHPEDQQTIIDFMESEEKPTLEEIILLSLDLNQHRKDPLSVTAYAVPALPEGELDPLSHRER